MITEIDGFSFCRHGYIAIVCLVCVRETHEEVNTLRAKVKAMEMENKNANIKRMLAEALAGHLRLALKPCACQRGA